MEKTPELGQIREDELEEVAHYLERQKPKGEAVEKNAMPPVERLKWLLLENPWRSERIPLGWRLKVEGRVVGALVCVPMRIGTGGREWIAPMSCKFYVDPPYRGMGVGLFRSYLQLGREYPLFCTSANAASAQMFTGAGGEAIAGTDHTMLGVARSGPLVEELVFRRTKSAALARVAGKMAMVLPSRVRLSKSVLLEPLKSPKEVALLKLPEPKELVAVVRDEAYLRWRYFGRDGGREVLRFDSEERRMVVVNQVSSGYRGQIRVLNVLDVWPGLTADAAPLLAGALWERYRGKFDALWLRSQSVDAEAALRSIGFVRHAFPCPLGWCIDRQKRLGGRKWYLVPGESE